VSGLETAIRNALDRSDRADGQTRARIYQSARQALDAGLRRQGVSDTLIIMQQHKRLEEKIREIETEEIDKLSDTAAEPVLPPDAMEIDPPSHRAAAGQSSDEILLGGETRQTASDAGPVLVPVADPVRLDEDLPQRREPIDQDVPGQPPLLEEPSPRRKGRTAKRQDSLDVAPERAAKPRRRRGFLSRLITWVVTLAIVAGGCWWFYNSGMIQSIVQEAIEAANRASRGQAGQGNPSFDPRGGFSDEWSAIFKPSDAAALKVGRQASAEAVAGSEGPAVRILSATPGDDGDVVLDVPADVLRDMAAKRSTIALTVQSGVNQAVQITVRCDFGSLGNCTRHRFTATQEKLEALFSVTFERTLAPNTPGRLIINAGIDGPDKPVLLYAVRILPGS
jgi:hypothetical protein